MATKTNQKAIRETKSKTAGYPNGGSFDTSAASSYPIDINPAETIQHILLPIVNTGVDLELTTTGGDVLTIPVETKSSIDSYAVDRAVIKNPTDATKRVAGGWAGE